MSSRVACNNEFDIVNVPHDSEELVVTLMYPESYTSSREITADHIQTSYS